MHRTDQNVVPTPGVGVKVGLVLGLGLGLGPNASVRVIRRSDAAFRRTPRRTFLEFAHLYRRRHKRRGKRRDPDGVEGSASRRRCVYFSSIGAPVSVPVEQ